MSQTFGGVVILWLIIFARIIGASPPASTMSKSAAGPLSGQDSSSLKSNVTISREHVTLFFDHRVRYHSHEEENAYSKQDLAAMVNVISQRFTKLIIDTAPNVPSLPPNDTAPSRIWIPSIVAQHNKVHYPHTTSIIPPTTMEVIVSFEFDADLYDHTGETSFDVARHMADTANQIYPGTVKTLMMTMYRTDKLEYADESYDYSYFQYVQDWHPEDTYELNHIAQLYHFAYPYQLGVFMDVHDCGRFRGELPGKVKEILHYVELVGLFIDPTSFHHLTTLSQQDTRKMFVAKFEDCERKIKGLRPEITVMPSSLWKSHHVTIEEMVEEWRMMSAWAVENDKEVIMYEAFDTPGGRDFYYWGHGWWRLRDRTEYAINETSFVEKINDANSEIYTKRLYSDGTYSLSDSSEKEMANITHNNVPSTPPPSINCTTNSSTIPNTTAATSSSQVAPYPPPNPPPTIIHTATSTNHAVYIVLVLLSAICAVLVFAHLYFHSKLIKNGGCGTFHHRKGRHHHSFANPLPSSSSSSSPELGHSSPSALMNPHYHKSQSNELVVVGHDNAMMLNDNDDGVASINGSVMEMADDTTPIVSVSYKKM